ncbi:MAG: hypothetical protein Q9166_003102 [cf. Caloplaca sp. 2 TL-2023]
MSKEATKESQGMREEVMVNLAQHHDGVRNSIHLVYDEVDLNRSSTPAVVDRVLGQLFVGYAGIPILNDKCDVSGCDKSQVPHFNVEYWFPLGLFWSQIVRLQVGYQSHLGPQASLSMLRRIPDSAPCVNFALNGNIDGLKDLFKRGLASPKDVSSTRGYSILRVSLDQVHYIRDQMLNHASGHCMVSSTTLANSWSTQVLIQIIGTHLLQIAAMYADMETIEIRKATNHFALSYDRSYIAADFATLLRKRWDVSEKLTAAFEELIQLIDRNPGDQVCISSLPRSDSRSRNQVSQPSMLESGLLPCANDNSNPDIHSEDDSSDQSFDDAKEML